MSRLYKVSVSFFEYLLMLMMILEFNTPYIGFQPIRRVFYGLVFLSLLVLIVLKWKMDLGIIAYAAALIIGSSFPALNVFEDRLSSYIRLYVVFLPMFVICLFGLYGDGRAALDTLWVKFSNIVSCIAVVSLAFWLLGSILEIVPSTALIPNSWGGERFIPTYYGVYFETQEAIATSGAESIVRNSGIFNEAPMYNMILCVSLAIECFVRRNISLRRISLIVLTILSTVSTTGIIFLLFILFAKSYLAFSEKYRLQLMILSPLIVIAGIIAVASVLDNKKETGEGSYNSRGGDIVKCVEVGLENPVLGVGVMFGGEEGTSESRSFGYSNSLFGAFAHGGVYFVFFYLFSLFMVPLLLYWHYKDISLLMIMLSYFLLFTFTVSQYKFLTIFMASYGLVHWYVRTFTSEWWIQSGQ